MKAGDKLYCIKDNFSVSSIYNKDNFSVSSIYNKAGCIYDVILFPDGNDSIWVTCEHGVCYYSKNELDDDKFIANYFISLSELRKRKLKKINEGRR